jgi:methylmalonyl-CoA/ethylmalonyl-CoA epimerase
MTVSTIDHVAFVVSEISSALPFWSDTLGLALKHVKPVPDQEVLLAVLTAGESSVELVEPTTCSSGVARFLARRGPGFHHICLRVNDIETEIIRLTADGCGLVGNGLELGASGYRVAFLHPRSTSGVLIELSE